MLKFKFLSGDVNWKEYGGKFVSKKFNNGDWDYWLVISVLNMWDATGDENQPKYYVTVNAVAPDAVLQDDMDSAFSSMGFDDSYYDWYESLSDDHKNLCKVETLVEYGISTCLWQSDGNNINKLMKEARKEAQMINMLFGFYMDRQLNAIGNDGWDFISGNIGVKKEKIS